MAPETKDEYIIAWAITVKTTTMTYCGIFFFYRRGGSNDPKGRHNYFHVIISSSFREAEQFAQYHTASKKKNWEFTSNPSDAFSYSLIQYLWRICYVPEPSLGTVDAGVNKLNTNPDPMEEVFWADGIGVRLKENYLYINIERLYKYRYR